MSTPQRPIAPSPNPNIEALWSSIEPSHPQAKVKEEDTAIPERPAGSSNPIPEIQITEYSEAGMSDRHYSESSKSKAKGKSHESSSHHHSSSSSTKKDDWSEVAEPAERRRIQNRLAQRTYREKKQTEREIKSRDENNNRRAGSSYTTLAPEDLNTDDELSGLPWGSLSLKHVVKTGHDRDRESRRGGSGGSGYEGGGGNSGRSGYEAGGGGSSGYSGGYEGRGYEGYGSYGGYGESSERGGSRRR